jgi:hypothetical protein
MKLSQILTPGAIGTTAYLETASGFVSSVSTGQQWLPDIDIAAGSNIRLELADGTKQFLVFNGSSLIPASTMASTGGINIGSSAGFLGSTYGLIYAGLAGLALWYFFGRKKRRA